MFVIILTCGNPDIVVLQTEGQSPVYAYWSNIVKSPDAMQDFQNALVAAEKQKKITVVEDNRGICL